MTQTKPLTIREMTTCALFTTLIIIGAFIKIPIPYVPVTLQFLFVNMAALFQRKHFGSLSVLLYIILGLIGIPVFTRGGGISYIFQPTFGYILGFLAGTFISGIIINKMGENSLKVYLFASFANFSAVYILGMTYYFCISNFYLKSPVGVGFVLFYCFVLFIPGDVTWCIVSSVLAKRLSPFLKKN